MSHRNKNHLSDETSPYLRQHADNPVEWYPWCEEALERARREDKPILLSIGYSACHWCHVMAHESFEDPATAEVMNRLFINIKVDREERPDLDKIYQLAHQILTQRPGGWPLNMFLTPHDHIPYFGGTYFPNKPKYNMPAFVSLLHQVADYYREQKEAVAQFRTQFTATVRTIDETSDASAMTPHPDLLHQAREAIGRDFDPEHGGFGRAPKFPHATDIEFLLRYWASTDGTDANSLEMVTTTLKKMAEGGLYDQLGGGFCRYSVDDAWLIPHFEKMLYDNGALLALYSRAWQATQEPLFKTIALQTAEWVMREMQSPEGGYYSSLDADSEGEEGRFYVWEKEELKHLLTGQEYTLVEQHYGLDRPANFEGRWHLHVARPLRALLQDLALSEADGLLSSARKKLFDAREQRVHPGLDDKILTSWNALMIKAMTIAGRQLDRGDLVESAQRALDFLKATVWRDGGLLATYKDDTAHLNAYLDDYAFLIDALLESLQTRWRSSDLLWAQEIAAAMLGHFEDTTNGGFFFTSNDHEPLFHRPKPLADESTPAGNAIAAYALARLGHLLSAGEYVEAAERTITAATEAMKRIPQAHGAFLVALEEMLQPPRIIVIRGPAMDEWHSRLRQTYTPRQLCFAIPADETGLPGILAERKPTADTVAYVCTETACLPPAASWQALSEQLDNDARNFDR